MKHTPLRVDPLPSGHGGGGGGGGGGGLIQKFAPMMLKIGKRVAYGYAVIGMWGFFACQNCCGFRVILSQISFQRKIYKIQSSTQSSL